MLKVGDIMTPDPQVVGPEQTVAEASRLMEERRIGSLPVVEKGDLVGIITSRDLRLASGTSGGRRDDKRSDYGLS